MTPAPRKPPRPGAVREVHAGLESGDEPPTRARLPGDRGPVDRDGSLPYTAWHVTRNLMGTAPETRVTRAEQESGPGPGTGTRPVTRLSPDAPAVFPRPLPCHLSRNVTKETSSLKASLPTTLSHLV